MPLRVTAQEMTDKRFFENKARELSAILKEFHDIVQREYFMTAHEFTALGSETIDQMFEALESVYDKTSEAFSELTNKLYELFD